MLALRGSTRQLTARCHRPAAGSRFPRPGRSMLQCLLSFLLVVCIPYITCKPRVMESQARLEGQLNGSRQQQRSSSNGSVIDRRTVQRYAAVGRQYIDSSMHARVPITVLAHYLPMTLPTRYLPMTCPLPTHYLPITCNYLSITYPLPAHYLPITYPLPAHYLPTTCPLPAHYLPFTCPLPAHYLPITCH